jgi:hypothetical protein
MKGDAAAPAAVQLDIPVLAMGTHTAVLIAWANRDRHSAPVHLAHAVISQVRGDPARDGVSTNFFVHHGQAAGCPVQRRCSGIGAPGWRWSRTNIFVFVASSTGSPSDAISQLTAIPTSAVLHIRSAGGGLKGKCRRQDTASVNLSPLSCIPMGISPVEAQGSDTAGRPRCSGTVQMSVWYSPWLSPAPQRSRRNRQWASAAGRNLQNLLKPVLMVRSSAWLVVSGVS